MNKVIEAEELEVTDLSKEEEYLKYRRSFLGRLKDVLVFIFVIIGFYYFYLFAEKKKDFLIAFSFIILAPILINLPAIIYRRVRWINEKYSVNLLKFYEWSGLLFLVLSGTGSIYLWYLPIQFDCFVHFIETFLAVLMIVIAFSIWREHRHGKHLSAEQVWKVFMPLAIVISVGWEIYQFVGDRLMGTKMFFDFNQVMMIDALTDMLSGIAGSYFGGRLVAKKYWEKILKVFQS